MYRYRNVFFFLGIFSFALLIFYIFQKQITDSIPANVYILAPADSQLLTQSSQESTPIYTPTVDDSFFNSIMSSVFVTPKIAQAGAQSRYDIEYLAQKSLFPGGRIIIQFPFAFNVSTACPTIVDVSENTDLNGFSDGEPRIDAISCDSSVKSISVIVGKDPIRRGDTVRFVLGGILNATTQTSSLSTEHTATIQTMDHAGNYLESLVSLPFFLEQAGTQSISGTIFNDDGSGTHGTPDDVIKNGDERGIAGAQVCLNGYYGYQCQSTSVAGTYRFETLRDGYYSLDVPTFTSGNFIGGPFFQSIELHNGANESGIDFGFTSSDRMITVAIAGIPPQTGIDVFASNAFAANGGYVLRELAWNGNSTRSIDLPISDGYWEVGIGPALSKDPLSVSTALSDFAFIPPQSQQVLVSGVDEYRVSFALQSADKQLSGKIVDASGVGIPNAFVSARPAIFTDEMGKEKFTESRGDGSFTLKVAPGAYLVEVFVSGLPPPPSRDATVKADTDGGAQDGNASADIYSEGVRITNDGDGGADNFLFILNTRNRSITGRVLDESNQQIAYAFVGAEQVDSNGNPTGAWSDSPADANGKYTLFVTDGTWKIRAFDPRYGEVGSKTVVVSGANLTGQNIQSPQTFGTVSGVVTKNNVPAKGVFVNIYGPSGSNGGVTDTNGLYSIKTKAGSGYTIEGFLPGVGSTSVLENVTVKVGTTTSGKNLFIETPGTIVVSVPGVIDAFVDAFDSTGRGNSTNANSTPGSYVLTIPPGTYTVGAHSIDYGLLGEKSGVAVMGGSTTTVVFTAPAAYVVSGKIISPSAICKDGAFVSLSDITNGRMIVKTTDVSGSYSVSVPNGIYLLSASKPGCVEKSEPIEISVSGANVSTNTNQTLVLPVSSIEGRVLLSGSNTTLDTVVIAESADGRAVSTIVDTTKKTENNYSLSLGEGAWSLRARSDGYESASKSATIAAGDNQTIQLALSPIAGYVKTERVYTSVKPSQGGVVKDSNIGNDFAIKIPAGVLGSSANSGSVGTKVTTAVVEKTATARVVGGKGIEITPKDSSGKPITTLSGSGSAGVTVTMPYSENDVIALGIDESKLVLATWSVEKLQWEPLATTVNTEQNTLTAVVKHFSVFAPVSPAEKIETPSVAAQAPVATQQQASATAVPLGTALPPASPSIPSTEKTRKILPSPAKETSITPGSASERVTTVIETSGGVVSVSVPSGAVDTPVTLAVLPLSMEDASFVAPLPPETGVAGGMIYDITLQSDDGSIVSELLAPAEIKLFYSDEQVAYLQEDTLAIRYWDRSLGRWVLLSDSTLDAVAHTVTATARHFTLFAVTGLLKQTSREMFDSRPLDKGGKPSVVPEGQFLSDTKKVSTTPKEGIQKKQKSSRKSTLSPSVPVEGRVAERTDTVAVNGVPVKDDVRATPAVFDVFISVPERYKNVAAGGILVSQIKIGAESLTREYEIDAHYVIRDASGNDVTTKKERIKFVGSTAYVKSFVLPKDMKPGTYRAVVRITAYNTEASATFTVIAPDEEQDKETNPTVDPRTYENEKRAKIFLSWVAAVIFIVVVRLLLLRKRR